MGKYRVVYYHGHSNHLYGVVDSIGEAIEMENQCREYGYSRCWMEARDLITDQWVRIN